MKRFNKAILITIIASLLVALMSVFIIDKVFGLYAGSDTIYGYDDVNPDVHNVTYNLEDCYNSGKTVKLMQYYNQKKYGEQLNTLNQPNIWCVQHGVELSYGEYSVSEKYVVQDDVLAYILANGPTEQQENYKDEWQYVLWYYLEDTADYGEKSSTDGMTDKERIKKNVTGTATLTDSEKEAVQDLYDEAIEYATNVSESGISTSEITVDGNVATFTVNGEYETLKVFLNGEETTYTIEDDSKKVTIDISGITDSEVNISVEATINKYSAEYRILYAEENLKYDGEPLQRLLVASGVKEEDKATSTYTPPSVKLNTEVSLQKYITAVNGEALTTEQTDLTERKNQMTEKSDESILDEIYGQTVKENISGAPAEENKVDPDNKKYKRGETDEDENAVKIEVSDTVTYTIEVYNNSTVPASKIYLRDKLPEGAELVEAKRDDTVLIAEEWKENSFSSADSLGDVVDLVIGNKYYECIIENLASGQKTCFEVTVKFNEYSEETLVNTAWISKTEPDNITENYRIEDKDYVKMNNPFKVSLEKYISAVNGVAPTGDDAGREGKAEYLTVKSDGTYVNETESDTAWTQHNTYKKDHIVTVSKGDIVTYTIKVTNDGKSQVYISEITDWFPNGVKYGENEYLGDAEGKLDSNKVTFNNLAGELLESGESASFTVDVEVIEENNTEKIMLKNTAKITMIKDTKGNEVDADDHDTSPFDNEDSDYIDLNYVTPPPPVEEKTSYYVEKIWSDNNDRKGLRPDKITVELHRIGDGKLEEIELSGSGNIWTYEWKDLAKYDDKGNQYQYFVKEQSTVPNYTTTYPTDAPSNTTKIKNTYYEVDPPAEPEKINITTEKFWKNDSVTTRPASIKVQLYKDGNPEGSAVEISPNSEGRWIYTWNDLDKSYKYTVEEVDVPTGYTVGYSDSGYSIYNTYNVTPPDPDVPITPDIPVVDYSVISGFVWNDIAQNKTQNNYDGLYQVADGSTIEKEIPIEGVKVMLYRVGRGVVLQDYTDRNGKYGFNDASFSDPTKCVADPPLPENEKYIKGPKDVENKNWTGLFYSYYVIFEYDGVTYTSTKYNSFTSNNNIDSNAEEDNNLLELASVEKVVKSRDAFNNNFKTINNGSGINYDTVNESGYIPQSRHNAYTDLLIKEVLSPKYQMQSSTDLINMATASEMCLDHVNLGLRGRDIFDLELTSDVVKIDVNINNQPGVYKNTNRVNLRNSDIKLYEDMANVEQEESNDYDAEHNQYIRESDKNALGEITGEITVTYKITVFNASPTPGKATKITNYFDDCYDFVAAFDSSGTEFMPTQNSGAGYNSIEITTPETILKQSEKMEIYVVYSLKDSARHDIGTLSANERYITYNMSEITEYTADAGGDKYTRGLIDKDSAPGSANKEQVRTTDTEDQNTPTSGGNPTTIGYYFGGNYLSKLKYEDDTYATPVVYTISDSKRTIEGYVFEDLTTIDSGTKIKTGNGKLDDGEVGIHGATVELIEQGGSNSHYVTDSNENGYFSFSGFLPGNYIVKYFYGDTEKTVLLGQYDEDTNKESYNGEDYQSTNNTGKMGGTEAAWLNKLSDLSNFWYVFNEKEGISTATDDEGIRNQVSANVLSFEPADIQKLNSIRELIGEYSDSNNGTLTANKKWNSYKNAIENIDTTTISGIKDIINSTSMSATTKPMLISVEETDELNELPDSSELLEKEFVIEKLDEHGNKTGLVEWCMFPDPSSEYYKDYTITNMNFGIAKVPVTTVDLDKYISGFTITDSTGNNVISSLSLETDAEGNTRWNLKGDSLYIPAGQMENAESKYDVSIEDEKLQGARLEITYTISQKINKEVNFNGGDTVKASATIKGIVDFVDNNLTYNPELGNNKIYWDIITYKDLETKRNKLVDIYNRLGKNVPESGIGIPEETDYTTILELKESSGFYNLAGGTNTATITLEKVLSSTNSTIDGLLSEVLDDSGYSNEIRITGWEYTDTTDGIDRIRTEEGYIILPGLDHDYSKSEILVIHPPTGSNLNILYLVIAVISLAILAAGVFGIRKFVIKK